MSINKAFLTGNITRDPELKTTAGGTSILSFGLAVNDGFKNNSTGEWEDRPNFFDCKVFGKRGESLSRILSRGMKVSVEGKLSWSQWTNKDTGEKRSKIDVIVAEVELMSSNQERSSETQETAPEHEPEYVQASIYDDDIPF